MQLKQTASGFAWTNEYGMTTLVEEERGTGDVKIFQEKGRIVAHYDIWLELLAHTFLYNLQNNRNATHHDDWQKFLGKPSSEKPIILRDILFFVERGEPIKILNENQTPREQLEFRVFDKVVYPALTSEGMAYVSSSSRIINLNRNEMPLFAEAIFRKIASGLRGLKTEAAAIYDFFPYSSYR